MITILIVDDLESKIVNITKIIKSLNIQATIHVASDIINARKQINENRFDILVLDQFLPLRIGEDILENGGVELIKEIQRNRLQNIPRHIFGLSICDHIEHEYFWPFHKYDEKNTWIKPIKSLVNYCNIYNDKYFDVNEIRSAYQTVYLEGPSDNTIFKKAIEIYFPDFTDKIKFEFEIGGGCSWVVRQLFAQVFLLPKKCDGTEIKFCSIFDFDDAGRSSKKRIDEVIGAENAERRHFKTFFYKQKYSPLLKLIFESHKDVCLEDLYPPSIWLEADQKSLLEHRVNPLNFSQEASKEDIVHAAEILEPNLSQEELNKALAIYSQKFVPNESKKKVAFMFSQYSENRLETAMLPFKYVLSDIIDYLA